MANPDHLALVRQGAEAIDRWWQSREPRKGFLDLCDADLHQVNLRKANLTNSDLSGAQLTRSDLSEAILVGARLVEADCSVSNLVKANLTIANLTKVGLRGTKLAGAMLTYTDLTEADLSDADLTEAFLVGANFARSDLNRTDLTRAMFGQTILAAVELSQAIGLSTTFHSTRSTVGVDTLQYTLRETGNTLTPDLRLFFRAAGVPAPLLEGLSGIMAKVIYTSCFISYGEPDLDFAKRLYQDLLARGVTCWLYAMDATPGRRTQGEIGQKRREAERMVVLCSAQALIRDGVLKEIEEQIDDDPDKMVPVSLENLWKSPGFRVMRGDKNLKPYLLDKNYADFAAMSHDEALKRLLRGLERPNPTARQGSMQ